MKIDNIEKIVGKSNIKYKESMKKHTTFRCGGNAEVFITPDTKEDFIKLVKFLKTENKKFIVIGRGSNLLVKDGGIDSIVINTNKLNEIKVLKNEISVNVGASLALIAIKARDNELTGMEGLCAIPGSFGGAVYMNAGAHGVEIKDVLIEVEVLDKKGDISKISPKDLDLSYRHSNVEENGYIILGGTIKLSDGNKEEISKKMEEYKEFRKSQPSQPSAGSTFKRGDGFITAKLIDEAGLKGYSIGDACVSEKHAGFVVNKGNAKSKEILDVIDYVKKEVYNKYNVKITEEVRIVGKDE